MRVSKAVQRIATGVLAAAAVSTALVATVAAPASASKVATGSVKLCNHSNYYATVDFPDRGVAGGLVSPGDCWRVDMGGLGRTEKLQFKGLWNTNPGSFSIYTANVNLSNTGIGVTVAGTTTNPTFTVW